MKHPEDAAPKQAERKAPQKHVLSDAYIRGRPRPAKGSVIDFDAEVKGFALRFTAAEEATFLFCYGAGLGGGSQRRMVIDKWTPSSGTKTASVVPKARKRAAELRLLVQAKRDPYAEQVAEAAALEAQRESDKLERERLASEAEAAKRREAAELTVDQLCDLYLEEHCATLRAATKAAAAARLARYVRPAWGSRKAHTIAKADVKALLSPIRKAGKAAEVMHLLTLVSGVFQFARANDDIEGITANPTEDVRKTWLDKKTDVVKPKERVLTKAREFRSFYLLTRDDKGRKGLPADVAACLRLMMLTAARPSEVAGLEWSEIDFHAQLWTKPTAVDGRSKSERSDVVPLVDEAMKILAARRSNGSKYVFPSGRSKRVVNGLGEGVLTVNRLDTALRRSLPRLARIGVAPFTPHDIRRTVATGLADMDVPDAIIMGILNHSLKGVTRTVYIRTPQLPQRRAALERWAAYLESNIRGAGVPRASNVLPFVSAGVR